MKTYTYTGSLTEAEYETRAFGVLISSRLGTAKTWWTVPLKYTIMVMLSARDEYIDFMSETGMTLAISTERAANGQLRVWFIATMDFQNVMDYIKTDKPEWWNPTMTFNNILYARNEEINKAANYAVEAKKRFQDFIRKYYYERRMHSNYDSPVPRKNQPSVVVISGSDEVHQFASMAEPTHWVCPHAGNPDRKDFGHICTPFEPCDMCVEDGTWKR